MLPVEMLEAAIGDAAALGYRAMSVSGGEPLLYRPLIRLLDGARAQGMLTTISTNGIPVSEQVAARLKGRVDLVAVSVDGSREGHDRIRARAGAFEGMARGVGRLRQAGVPFGFIFTLTQHSLADLPFVVDFALAEGAALLQLHPLDNQGRAVERMTAERPDAVELAVAAVVGEQLRRFVPELAIQVDAVSREAAAADPVRFQGTGVVGPGPLGDWVGTLVIRSDGQVVPLTYDFPSSLSLGSLHEARLATLARAWHADGRAGRFAHFCRRAYQRMIAEGPRISYWYDGFTSAVRAEIAATAP
jgi:MoaA/NifB/PqqE/SkfB family radical SAM enzyme